MPNGDSKENLDFKTYVEAELKYLRGRIDNGISPTMQAVKDQNAELSKDMLRLENKFLSALAPLQTQISVMDEHFSGPLKEYETLKSSVYGFLIKGAGAFIVILGGMFVSMWVFINQVKAKIDLIPPGSASIEKLKAVPFKGIKGNG